MSEALEQANEQNVAIAEEKVDEKIDVAVTEQVDEKMAAVSWAERMRWKGDFRYRYEHIDPEGDDTRNRSRIRARTHLEADLSPTRPSAAEVPAKTSRSTWLTSTGPG
jgi:hypothetical protein